MKSKILEKPIKHARTGAYKITEVITFNTINEFYDYLANAKMENQTFRGSYYLSSQHKGVNDEKWYGTETFEEALELLKNGDLKIAKKLTQKINAKKFTQEDSKQIQKFISVAGFQPIVPLFLMDAPANMINTRLVTKKNKILTITKCLSASSSVSAETLQEEAIKCFVIIDKLEKMGYRCNLNIALDSANVVTKVCLKKANEKMHISKLAFALTSPAMLRRLSFRVIETYKGIKVCSEIKNYYGTPMGEENFKEALNLNTGKNEIILPTILYGDAESEIEKITQSDLLKKI